MAEVGGRRFVVRGRVQGVGFRFFVLRQARLVGLAGTVRNLPDGAVEVLAWGGDAALTSLRAALGEGPGHARVDAVDEQPLAAERPGDSFYIID